MLVVIIFYFNDIKIYIRYMIFVFVYNIFELEIIDFNF